MKIEKQKQTAAKPVSIAFGRLSTHFRSLFYIFRLAVSLEGTLRKA